jgi:hypothetical protein
VTSDPEPTNEAVQRDETLMSRARLLGDRVEVDLEDDPNEAVQLGVDLLLAGFDGPGVLALASLPPRSAWTEVEPLTRSALEEIGLGLPAESAGVSLAKINVSVVLLDVERTTGLRPSVTVENYRGGVMILCYDGGTAPSVSARSNPEALAETADYLQEHVAEEVGTAGQATLWPVCLTHSRMRRADVDAAEAVWNCPRDMWSPGSGNCPPSTAPIPACNTRRPSRKSRSTLRLEEPRSGGLDRVGLGLLAVTSTETCPLTPLVRSGRDERSGASSGRGWECDRRFVAVEGHAAEGHST